MASDIAVGDVLEVTLDLRVGHILPGGDILVGNTNMRLDLDRNVKHWRHLDDDADAE